MRTERPVVWLLLGFVGLPSVPLAAQSPPSKQPCPTIDRATFERMMQIAADAIAEGKTRAVTFRAVRLWCKAQEPPILFYAEERDCWQQVVGDMHAEAILEEEREARRQADRKREEGLEARRRAEHKYREECRERAAEARMAAPKNKLASTNGFRGSPWGATVSEVKTHEGPERVYERDNTLTLVAEVAGVDAAVSFTFIDDKLVQGLYLITATYTNKNMYLSDYATFKQALTNLYGAPAQDGTLWLNDLYQHDPSQWGFAVSLGHLKYMSTWETAHTRIRLFLVSDNYDIRLMVRYTSRRHAGLIERAAATRKLDGP